MKPKLSDVAKFAGVSLATADRVINNRPGVRDKTRQKVMDAVERLGYQPDPVAALLAKSSAKKIALVLPSDGYKVANTIERHWQEIQHSLHYARASISLIYYVSHSEQSLLDALDRAEKMAHGIILTAPNSLAVCQRVDEMSSKGILVYTLMSGLMEPVARRHVGYDNYKLGRMAAHVTKLLLEGKAGNLVTHSLFPGTQAYSERIQGHKDYLDESGWDCRFLTIVNSDAEQGAAAGLMDELKKSSKPVGIICLGGCCQDIAAEFSSSDTSSEPMLTAIALDLDRDFVQHLVQDKIQVAFYLDVSRAARHAVRMLVKDLEELKGVPAERSLPPHYLDFYIFSKENLPQWALDIK